MITGIHHFTIIASSENSVRFYAKLGFEEYKRISRVYDTVVLMGGFNFGLEIYIDPSHPAKSVEPLGLRNISLKVNNIEETLESLGINNSPIMKDWVGGRFVFIYDPDGLQIQLHE